MVAGLEPSATAVINADDAFAALWRGMTRARVVTFGVDQCRRLLGARPAHQHRRRRVRHALHAACTRRVPMPIELHLAGRHNVLNALCAAAAACAAGATLDEVRAGLATMRPVPGRLQFKTAPSGAWIVDDSYNANPSSMKAGIEVLAAVDARRWLVMGDMGELGDFASESHQDIGRFARNNRIDRLFATGKLAALAVEAFGSGGEWFADTEALARAVNAELTREVCVLVKGSRSNRLERVVEALVGSPARLETTEPTEERNAVLARQTTHALLLGIQRLLVPDGARHLRGDHRAGARPAAGSVDDREAEVRPDRPGGARRRTEDAFLQGGHAHHGRHADPHRDLREHAAVDRPHQSLRVGGAHRHVLLRPHRLLGRLPQAREEESARD